MLDIRVLRRELRGPAVGIDGRLVLVLTLQRRAQVVIELNGFGLDL